jgi:serine/threonine protein kinase
MAYETTNPYTAQRTKQFADHTDVELERAVSQADLFSFGVVIYEMSTGHLPFERKTVGATYAAILHEPPEPVTRWNSHLPVRLDEIISKALQKDRQLRYQHASEIRSDLQHLEAVSKSTATTPSGPKSIATPPKRISDFPSIAWKTAVPVGVTLLASLGVIIFGLAHKPAPHATNLNEKDTIVLADFANTTGDAVFDDTLKTGLSVALRQSPFLNLLSDNRVGSTLKLMTRPADTPLTPDITREVWQRSDSKSVYRRLDFNSRKRIRAGFEGGELPERRYIGRGAGDSSN